MNTNLSKLIVKKLKSNAIVPKVATQGSAGIDLYCIDDIILKPNGIPNIISTGISMVIPKNYYGRIAGRSGLASK